MTLASFTLILAVALVNLTIGFGAAALVGRGPWSVRGRNLLSAPRVDAAAATISSPSHEVEANQASTDVSIRPEESAAGTCDALPVLAPYMLQPIAASIELVEQELQALLQQIQEGGDSPPKEMPPNWAATMMSQANQLSEIHDEFRHLVEQHDLPPDIQKPAAELLIDLQQRCQSAVMPIGQVRTSTSERSSSITGLLTACQAARGAIVAISFFQSQP